MRENSPKRRLVGAAEYIGTIGSKGAGYTFACVFIAGGLILLLVGGIPLLFILCAAVLGLIRDGGSLLHDVSALGNLVSGLILCVLCAGIGCIGGIGIMIGGHFFRAARETAPVGLLTRSSAKHLPEVETLVRGSDQPGVVPEAELLRAVRLGQATPPEQLLRPTQENSRNA